MNPNDPDWDADEDRPAWETKGRVVYSHGFTEWASDEVYKHRGRYWLSSPENGFSDGPFKSLAEALRHGMSQLTDHADSIDYDRREIRLRDLLGRLEVVTGGFRGVTVNGVPYHLDGGREWVRGEPPEGWTGPEGWPQGDGWTGGGQVSQ
jgi:hypothetical protein